MENKVDIVHFVEDVLNLKLFPYQKAILRILEKLKGPIYWTYGNRKMWKVSPSEFRGLREKLMIYDDCRNYSEAKEENLK